MKAPPLAPLALALAAACAAPSEPDPAPAARGAIAAVLAADEEAGARRNRAPETGPVADAVVAYVAELDGLELDRCPPDFAAAMRRHRDAWAATIAYLEAFGHLRGEMHDVFDEIGSDANPTAARFEELVAAIWSTWAEVEAAARRAGHRAE